MNFFKILIFFSILLISKISHASNYVDNIKKFQVNNSDFLLFKKNTKIVDFSIIIRDVGFAYEKINGLNLFVKHLIEMGSQSYQYRDFKNILDEHSINFSVHSDFDNIYLRVRVLKQDLNQALSLVSKALFDTNFSEENFNLAKVNSLSDTKNLYDDFQKLSYRIFLNEVFHGTLYEDIVPKVVDIERINLDQVKNFITHDVLNANYQFTCVGDLDEGYISKLFSEYFLFKKSNSLKKIPHNINIRNNKKEKFIKLHGDKSQSIIYFSYPSYKLFDDRYWKMKLLVDYLGGDKLTSVLMKKLREEMNVAYTARMDFINFNLAHVISGNVLTSSKEIKTIILQIKDIFKQISYNGIDNDELEFLKNRFYSKSDMLFINNESILNVLQFLIINGLPTDYLLKMKMNIENLSIDEINKFIKKFINYNELSFLVVN
jgi:predicted Zn-dependent peptidase